MDSINYDPWFGHPSNATTAVNIDYVLHIVMADRLTINQIVNDISISCKVVENMLDNELGKMKVSAREFHVFWQMFKSIADLTHQAES